MTPWTGTIQSIVHQNGNLLVGVSYTNGVTTFTESMNMNGSNAVSINQAIQNRLSTLNQNDIVVATITPSILGGKFTVTSSIQANLSLS